MFMRNVVKKTREENIREAIDLILSEAENELPEFVDRDLSELDPDEVVTIVCPSCERRVEMAFKEREDYICSCGWDSGYVIAHHEVN